MPRPTLRARRVLAMARRAQHPTLLRPTLLRPMLRARCDLGMGQRLPRPTLRARRAAKKAVQALGTQAAASPALLRHQCLFVITSRPHFGRSFCGFDGVVGSVRSTAYPPPWGIANQLLVQRRETMAGPSDDIEYRTYLALLFGGDARLRKNTHYRGCLHIIESCARHCAYGLFAQFNIAGLKWHRRACCTTTHRCSCMVF